MDHNYMDLTITRRECREQELIMNEEFKLKYKKEFKKTEKGVLLPQYGLHIYYCALFWKAKLQRIVKITAVWSLELLY